MTTKANGGDQGDTSEEVKDINVIEPLDGNDNGLDNETGVEGTEEAVDPTKPDAYGQVYKPYK